MKISGNVRVVHVLPDPANPEMRCVVLSAFGDLAVNDCTGPDDVAVFPVEVKLRVPRHLESRFDAAARMPFHLVLDSGE